MQSDTYLENTPAHTFIFAGKAAPGYGYAKSIIRLCGRLAERVNNDPKLNKKFRIVFLPNFNVSIAQQIYPAADISQQISTAGMEASGTGNMKFMMNGAVTLGTLDGANIEIADLVGEENIKIFGMTVEEIAELHSRGYNPWEVLAKDVQLRNLLSNFQNGFFGGDVGQFNDIYDSLLKYGDTFYVLKDFYGYFKACIECEQLYQQADKFEKMQIHNIAMSGHFSSDRSIREYAREIWNIEGGKQ
jgi:starch phosphorylase